MADKKKKKVKFKESLGIDIGTHSVKLVHLKKLHQGFKLLNYEIRNAMPEGYEDSLSDLKNDRYVPILMSMLKSLNIRPKKIKHIVTSIGGNNTSIKQIKTIYLPDDELESALFFEAKKHLPMSGAEMILDYQVISIDEKTNNMNILLASTSKEMLQDHTDILTNAGIPPGIVDIESLAVANSFALNSYIEEGVYVILNIGAVNTNMVVYGPNAKFFARDVAWGGHHFTKEIMKQQDISYSEAEQYKMEYGLKEPEKEKENDSIVALNVAEKSIAEQIIQEVKRSLRFYVKEAGNSDFRKILLIGGGAKLKGLPEFIEEQMNVPTEVYNSYSNLERPEKFKDMQDPQLAVALGLAMRPE
jgi:type IV pilus assembly protein PilM